MADFAEDNGSFFDSWTTNDDNAESTTSPSFARNDEDGEIIEVIDQLSDAQVKTLSLLFIVSGTLSVLGSSTIVHKVLKNRSKATPYDRLMLGLSSSDIVASISWILTPFLLPEETSPRIWARGTDETCTLLGTISQFGYLAIFYNLVLSFYYLLTVRFAMKRQVFAKRYEPCMHIFGILYFAATAIVGGVLGVYKEVDIGLGCWVNEYPRGCEVDDSCISPQIGWAFGAGPLLITLIALATNNTVIYCHVKKTLGKGITKQQEASSTSVMVDASFNSEPQLDTSGSMTLSHDQLQKQQQQSQQPLQKRPSMANIMRDQVLLERRLQHQQRVQEVATQGFLYVVTFFLAYMPSQILRAFEAYAAAPVSESPLFPLFVLNAVLGPLQGFFNVFVYVRPNYTRLRLAYPELSRFWAIRRACLDPDIPKLSEASRMSTARSHNNLLRRSGASAGSGLHVSGAASKSAASSGRAFSSDLDVVHEDSEEDEDDKIHKNDDDDDEERTFSLTEEVNDILNDMKEMEAAASAEISLPHGHAAPPEPNNAPTHNTSTSLFAPAGNIHNGSSEDEKEFDVEQEYQKIYSIGPRKSCLRINFDGSITGEK